MRAYNTAVHVVLFCKQFLLNLHALDRYVPTVLSETRVMEVSRDLNSMPIKIPVQANIVIIFFHIDEVS